MHVSAEVASQMDHLVWRITLHWNSIELACLLCVWISHPR